MFNITHLRIFFCLSGVLLAFGVHSQDTVLTMKQAVQIALNNYPSIKSKSNQLNSSKSYLQETRTEYLPDANLSAQQNYGTINSQYGTTFGYRGLSIAPSGPVLPKQNWNAAFGALYLTNVNWDFFAFGRAVEKVKVQRRVVNQNESDLNQERFQHEIRTAAAYLNVVAAQRLTKVQQDNLNRALDLRKLVVARVKSGLNPGVDSSTANAEVSNAKILLTNAQENEAEQSTQLAQYMGVGLRHFNLDSIFVAKAPAAPDAQPKVSPEDHPTLQFYRNRFGVSDEQQKYLRTLAYPTFTTYGVFQGRGSGFGSGLVNNPNDFTSSYGSGVDPTRYNYIIGVAVVWNITSVFRTHFQVESQKYTSLQYRNDYDLASLQLKEQQALAETRISNSLKNAAEAPVEIKAANEAYIQKGALYRNGLATIVDFTQALYTLYRAETDSYVAYNNVWQALLYKAAATGDFGIFINNF
jgi:outer membrane protein TolC